MTKTAQVYGFSLYQLAREEGLEAEIWHQLQQVLEILDETPDYWRFLSALAISKEERCKALDEAFGGQMQPYLLNFMKILCENGSISQLRGCAEEYRQHYNADHNIVEVCAVTAVPMGQDLQKKLKEKLQSLLGQTVDLRCKVDAGCMGGVLLELPGRQLNGTVKHRLETLAASLKSASV